MLSKNAENPVGKRLRVAMLDFGADEAVVAKLPKRVPMKPNIRKSSQKNAAKPYCIRLCSYVIFT